jgi:D-galacturonate reductase
MKPLNILVVGGGMYVTGRGAPESRGTIMPALLEARRAGRVDRLAIATTKSESAQQARSVTLNLAGEMGVADDCQAFPVESGAGSTSLEAAAAFQPDAVIVSVPDHLHAEVCIPLIEAGYHCLVVKPMAGTFADAVAMADAADKAQVVAQVEFHKRLDESNLLLREAVRQSDLGDLLYATVEYSQRKMVPRDAFRNWAEKSNIFQYLGIHYVDLLAWATGFSPFSVTAWGQMGYLEAEGLETWDAMQVVIEWRRPDGRPFVSTHVTNWIDSDNNSAMSDQKINLVGTRGRFQADQKNRGVQTVRDETGVKDLNPYFTTEWRDDLTGQLSFHGYGIDSIMQFIGDVGAYREGTVTLEDLNRVRPSFRDGVVTTAVVEAAAASLRGGSVPKKVGS